MDSDELPILSIEDLTHRTKKISCANNRLPLTITKQNLAQPSLFLIGKLISHRNFHAPIILDIVNKAWKPSRRIQVKKMRGTSLFSPLITKLTMTLRLIAVLEPFGVLI